VCNIGTCIFHSVVRLFETNAPNLLLRHCDTSIGVNHISLRRTQPSSKFNPSSSNEKICFSLFARPRQVVVNYREPENGPRDRWQNLSFLPKYHASPYKA
jgi:hypothetical protein